MENTENATEQLYYAAKAALVTIRRLANPDDYNGQSVIAALTDAINQADHDDGQ